ncbi:hypothetical protein DFH08DRAFT_997055 [Mycena albidolilacea]|uniref:Uncharacterized protein n=1 Tax=Mycena albidolilacea TaxID=1033008 RepID=A0AAD7EU55_9AGAR|nr:hypothetical protein DFH08DRAFT_997055 [Mycena albidolilacea]
MAFYAGQGEIRPLSQIPTKYAPFNNAHRAIRRQDQSSFVLLDPVEPDSKEYVVPADMVASQSYLSYEVLIEEQIRLFIFHNLRMNDPNQDVTVHPLGYPEFAKVFNDFDESVFKFAYHDIFENWTFWDEKAKIASLKDFLVRDQDLEVGPPDGFVLVSEARWERAQEAVWDREERREKGMRFAKKKEGKNQPVSLFQQVVDPANRAAIGERRAKMQADYNARKRAAFHGNKGKASILGTSGGSAASTPNSSAAFEDGEVPEEPPATPSDAGGPSGSGGASSNGTSGDVVMH